LNKLEPALADLNKAIQLDPEDGATYEDKALVLARLKKYTEALARSIRRGSSARSR